MLCNTATHKYSHSPWFSYGSVTSCTYHSCEPWEITRWRKQKSWTSEVRKKTQRNLTCHPTPSSSVTLLCQLPLIAIFGNFVSSLPNAENFLFHLWKECSLPLLTTVLFSFLCTVKASGKSSLCTVTPPITPLSNKFSVFCSHSCNCSQFWPVTPVTA